MSIHRHKYLIHWAKTGQRKDEPAKVIVADHLLRKEEFFVFLELHSNVSNDSTAVLTVRANDVAMIETGEEVQR